MKNKLYFVWLMIACVVLGAGCFRYHLRYYDFDWQWLGLSVGYDDWLKEGRPADFQISKHVGRPSDGYFDYTNVITATNGVFRCRFGARRDWYPGILAITEDGQIIFVCTNGKVTISPQEYGVYP
jgi:hypothetical protein